MYDLQNIEGQKGTFTIILLLNENSKLMYIELTKKSKLCGTPQWKTY